jgi:Concanavalin A-like lectin/glucanases superfamily
MRLKYKVIKKGIFFLALGLAIAGCQKITHPPLGSYPMDTNPPGGPVKFYAAYDGINADSIRAQFASTDSVTSYVDGPTGKAIQFNPVLGASGGDSVYSFLIYPSANDFASATSFTFSFWMNIPQSKKDDVNADGVFALASSSNFWGNITVYADHYVGNSDSMQLKFHFANGSGDNWDFAGYTGANMWPKMYDGQWHQVVFVYDATTSTGTVYRDGVQFDQKTNETIKFDGNAANLVVGGFEQAANIQGDYGGNTWMSGFPGAIDQLKFYAEALSASEVSTNYANKQ